MIFNFFVLEQLSLTGAGFPLQFPCKIKKMFLKRRYEVRLRFVRLSIEGCLGEISSGGTQLEERTCSKEPVAFRCGSRCIDTCSLEDIE